MQLSDPTSTISIVLFDPWVEFDAVVRTEFVMRFEDETSLCLKILLKAENVVLAVYFMF